MICYVNSCSVLSIQQRLNSDNRFDELIPRPDEPRPRQDRYHQDQDLSTQWADQMFTTIIHHKWNTKSDISTYWYWTDCIIM